MSYWKDLDVKVLFEKYSKRKLWVELIRLEENHDTLARLVDFDTQEIEKLDKMNQINTELIESQQEAIESLQRSIQLKEGIILALEVKLASGGAE